MPIYFAWFTTALLSVGGDADDQNLPQSGRLLYCVRSGFLNIYPGPGRPSPIWWPATPIITSNAPDNFEVLVALLRVQGFSEALEILGLYANDSAARAIYIRYEKERDGKSDRQNG